MGERAAKLIGKKERPLTMADIVRELRLHGWILAAMLGIMWVEEIVDTLLGGTLDGLGIRPRDTAGLVGIPLAPFLHVGFHHLLANTVPFAVLGWLVLLRETWHFAVVTIAVTLLGGLGVWLLGQSGSVHVGASGLVFGYLGYLLLGGWFERRLVPIAGSLLGAALYGSLLWGVLPGQPGISWESHLFGFLAGIGCAWLLARKPGPSATSTA